MNGSIQNVFCFVIVFLFRCKYQGGKAETLIYLLIHIF